MELFVSLKIDIVFIVIFYYTHPLSFAAFEAVPLQENVPPHGKV